MLRKFACFFIVFGLSYLVQEFGWADQPQAYFWLDMTITILLIVIGLVCCLVLGEDAIEKLGLSVAVILFSCAVVAHIPDFKSLSP